MSFPLLMLLGFAIWTALVLICTIGVYRLSRVFTGRAGMAAFPADATQGAAWYQRAMRAHANCVENLPLFAVVVFALHASGISTPATDIMAGIVLAARVVQSVVHISTVQTDRMVTVRFSFFFAQLASFLGIAATVIARAV
ncbi:MAPEG family protein [Lysobacter terrae]